MGTGLFNCFKATSAQELFKTMEAVWNNSKANWPGMTSSPVYMWRTKPEGEYKKQRKSSVLKKSYGLNVFKQTISSKSQ